MLTPLHALAFLMGGTMGILIAMRLIEKLDELDNAGKNAKKAWLCVFIVIISVSGILLGIALFCSVAPNGLAKNTESENPIIITIDKLIAGEEVPVQEMRSLLAVTLYPSVEGWANVKNIPKEKKKYAISVVAEAIRKATVKIELPAEFLSNVEIAGSLLQTQKEN
jgi:hypothetical protein